MLVSVGLARSLWERPEQDRADQLPDVDGLTLIWSLAFFI